MEHTNRALLKIRQFLAVDIDDALERLRVGDLLEHAEDLQIDARLVEGLGLTHDGALLLARV